MLRKLLILTILTLIISTTFIKNHTKKLDEEIFSVKENINYLNSVKELVQLEHDYLSSPEKLLELNNLYFDNELGYSSKENITVIDNINEINLKNSDKNE
jgi:hypothetical protein|tara:strand:+ start:3094 stop:3393 length:300 start_codon:yes stop_codon:yes gene_type:complete